MYTDERKSINEISKHFKVSSQIIKRVLTNNNIYIYGKGERRNNYIIDGDIARIELKRRNKESVWAIIDIDDLEKVINFPYSWHSAYRKKTKSFYVNSTVHTGEKINGKWFHYTLYLHHFLLGYDRENKIDIDHINHDTLDNRKGNLRPSTRKSNSKNRNGKNVNNQSGYRNVAYIKREKHPYWVQLIVNGKNTCLGKFDDPDEAGLFAEEMRQKYYKEYAGENERVNSIY